MRTVKYSLALVFALALVANVLTTRADESASPKHNIKEVMKIAHGKGGLAKKVITGGASDEEKQELIELYVDLGRNTPPKGTPADWKVKTDAVVQAAKEVKAGTAGAGATLQKAITCGPCHQAHKK